MVYGVKHMLFGSFRKPGQYRAQIIGPTHRQEGPKTIRVTVKISGKQKGHGFYMKTLAGPIK